MDRRQLKKYLETNSNFGALRRKLKKQNPELLEEIESFWNFSHKPRSFMEIVYQYFHQENPVCEYGNLKKFEYWNTGYKCSKNCQCTKDKKRKTMIEKYGVEHAMQSETFKEKAANTLNEKYGVEHLHLVNVESKKQTNLERYGAETPLQSTYIRDRIKKSHHQKTGVDYPMQTADFQEKAKQHFEKNKQNILEKRLETIKKKNPDWYDFDNIKNLLSAKTRSEVALDVGCSVSYIDKIIREQDWTDFQNQPSFYENAICKLLDDVGSSYVTNTRSIISPYELDFYDKNKKIAIEFCGLRWHGENCQRGKDYHLTKYIMCQNLGIKLLQIFQDEWDKTPDTVRSIVSNLFRPPPFRLFARHLDVRDVDQNVAKEFYKKYHLQGHINSSINIALYDQNKIISMMSWRKGKTKNTWELTRYCVIPEYAVIGGAQRLFKNWLRRQSRGDMCYTYSDNRWFDGNVYKNLGFNFKHTTQPNYWYTKGVNRYHRLNFTKKKLVKMGNNSTLTEKTIMKNLGYDRIWDCGHKRWEIVI